MAKRLIVMYLEAMNDSELYRCGTCKNYGKAIVCDSCSGGSRWAFDTEYDMYDEKDFEIWKKNRKALRNK